MKVYLFSAKVKLFIYFDQTNVFQNNQFLCRYGNEKCIGTWREDTLLTSILHCNIPHWTLHALFRHWIVQALIPHRKVQALILHGIINIPCGIFQIPYITCEIGACTILCGIFNIPCGIIFFTVYNVYCTIFRQISMKCCQAKANANFM